MLTPDELSQFSEDTEINKIAENYELAIMEATLQQVEEPLKATTEKEFNKLLATGISLLNRNVANIQNDTAKKIQNSGKDIIEKPLILSTDRENANYKKAYNKIVPVNKGILKESVKDFIHDEINLTGTTAFEGMPLRQWYLAQVNNGFRDVQAGNKTLEEVSRDIANKMAEQGVQGLDYKSGSYINAYSGTKRNILTGINQASGKQRLHSMEETGTNLVEVTAHEGARPDHALWQGGIFWHFEKQKGYASLVEKTDYGSVTGLQGANCRHNFFPFIEGIMTPQYDQDYLNNIDPPPFTYKGKVYTYYKATQRQRAIENTIRKYKRRYALNGTDFDAKQINKWRDEYKEFSKTAGIREKWERTYSANYGRSEAGKVAWVKRQANKETALDSRLDYVYNGKKDFIPTGTRVTNMKTIKER